MGFSHRKFIVHDDGTLIKLRNAVFDRLLNDPQHFCMPALAGQRVRVADITVELERRRPVRVVRRVYVVLTFDDDGRLDAKRYLQQQWALAESALEPVLGVPGDDDRNIALYCAGRQVATSG